MGGLRDEAARFIEIGRRIERAEVLSRVRSQMVDARDRGQPMTALIDALVKDIELASLHAAEARATAHQLIAELGPGAALAARVLAAARAARAAWRAH